MAKMLIEYAGDLQMRATHELSGVALMTDAPPDNQGKGRSFSPTDLVATALASCMATIMGIVARRHDIDLTGMTASVEKVMASEPVRRIGQLNVEFQMPASVPEDKRPLFINAAETCPVDKSLHPDVVVNVNYKWL